MLYHNKCNNLIRQNYYFKISTIPIVTKAGLKKGMAEMDQDLKDKKEDKAEFYCPHCKKDVEVKELVSQCAMHGTFHPVDELYFNLDEYTIMCKSCIIEYNVANYKPLIYLIA